MARKAEFTVTTKLHREGTTQCLGRHYSARRADRVTFSLTTPATDIRHDKQWQGRTRLGTTVWQRKARCESGAARSL